MKERILFIGIGQCGGNIVNLFEKLGYNCLYINTSYYDLQSITGKNKYHIPSAYGCSKNRQKALEYAKDYYNNMIGVIEDRFPQQDLIFFVASLGGGTGSGLIPILSDVISRKIPKKHYGAIVVLPALNESLKSQINAVEAYKELINIKTIKNLYVLDNNIYDKFEINEKFTDMFDRFINITIPDKRGVIDKAELETLLTCRGNVVIKDYGIDNSIFTEWEYGCKYIAISLKDNMNPEEIRNQFGMPLDIFTGYNNKSTFIVSVGMNFPKRAIVGLNQNINNLQSGLSVFSEDVEIQLPSFEFDKTPKHEEDFDFDSIFGKYMR